MYLEKAKLEDFESYYQIKCERFITFWSWGDYEIPPRENLYRFYTECIQNSENSSGEKRKDIYLMKTEEGETAGYLYMDYSADSVDIPVAVSERFTKKGFARQAIMEGIRIAQAQGYRQSQVEIREDNTASIRLYTSCGYQRGEKTRELYSAALDRTIAMYAYRREITDDPLEAKTAGFDRMI